MSDFEKTAAAWRRAALILVAFAALTACGGSGGAGGSGPVGDPQIYVKAAHPDADDEFGGIVAISGDTIVVGVPDDDSDGSSETDNSVLGSGAVYVFVRTGNTWFQQAYLKASNAEADDFFGENVAISGETIVVGALFEAGDGTSEADNTAPIAGAAYVFVRTGSIWMQEAYLKASNPDADDAFSVSVAISGDVIAIGASGESSDGTLEANNAATYAGAAYVFVRTGGAWIQESYLKATNVDPNDHFGRSAAVSGDRVVIGADAEDGDGSSQEDNSMDRAGAVYAFP